MTPLPRLVLALVATAALVAAPRAQDRPLPDPATFLREVKARLQTDDLRQQAYSYVETQRKQTLDGDGRAKSESVTVSESYPGFPGERRWERVIERDGKRVPDAELKQKDEERRLEAERYAKKVATQTAADRAKQEREWEEDRRERATMVEDVFLVYDITRLGRERLDGHDVIAFALKPRPQSKPKTRQGRFLKSFAGKALISESDYELARLDMEAVDDATLGYGLLAKVRKGATASFTRRKVNNEAWLPARAEYRVMARVLLLKAFREGSVSEYSNYKKFNVETTATIGPAPRTN